MLNQSSTVFNATGLRLPKNLPILEKCGRVKTRLHYRGLNTSGEMAEYEVAKTVASIVSQGFTFANVPYAFFQPVGEQDGFQVFQAECGEARIPINDYRRLLSVSKRTTRGRQKNLNPQTNKGIIDMSTIDLSSTSGLGLSREQIVRICLFVMHQVGSLDNLLTDEQRQTAIRKFIDLNGLTLWIDDLAIVFRYEEGRLMLCPDPDTPTMIARFPRVAELARRFKIKTEFAPIDVTNSDPLLLKIFDNHLLTRSYAMSYNVLRKDGRASFQGITGTCTGDTLGRLVFRPDENGFNSPFYQHSVPELGQWDELTLETNAEFQSVNGVLVIA